MLNSSEISNELKHLGYELTVPNVHANGFTHPSLKQPIFVKMNAATSAPMSKAPLLIHPDYLSSLNWVKIKKLSVTEPNTNYKSTALTGFPKIPASKSHRAIALNVADMTKLHQILALLGDEASQISPTWESELAECQKADTHLKKLGTTETERDAVIRARIGQGPYRDALIAIWHGCSVTNVSQKIMLRASHIKPWRKADDKERLDPFNGLLLTPNLDQAFDQGLISFNDDGKILISAQLTPGSSEALNIHPKLRLRQIEPRHRAYLAWHREHLFRK